MVFFPHTGQNLAPSVPPGGSVLPHSGTRGTEHASRQARAAPARRRAAAPGGGPPARTSRTARTASWSSAASPAAAAPTRESGRPHARGARRSGQEIAEWDGGDFTFPLCPQDACASCLRSGPSPHSARKFAPDSVESRTLRDARSYVAPRGPPNQSAQTQPPHGGCRRPKPAPRHRGSLGCSSTPP